MYRIGKVLNHNTIIAITEDDSIELLVMGKGIGFGRKVAERIELPSEISIFTLEEATERGNAKELARTVSPECLEIANEILRSAETKFGNVDKNVLFPMADHIEYAVKRMRNHEFLSNPLKDDIRMLFAEEYQVALTSVPLLKKRLDFDIVEDEVGYIALHVHSAIVSDKVSQAMEIARGVKECVNYVEEVMGIKLRTQSIAYHRLMNHVRFMVLRGLRREEIQLNINDYMKIKFPKEFEIAQAVCDQLGISLKCNFTESEIGYLAMHLQRVIADEQKKEN